MPVLKRILVPVGNFSSPTSPALAKAAQLAIALKAQVELFHDLAMAIPVEALGPGETSLRSLKFNARRAALTSLEELAEPMRKRGVIVSTSVAWDYPGYEAIIRRSIATGADLIVVPRRMRHRSAALLGYTDWELLRLSPVPVLLVKSPSAYRRSVVLAAIDPTHEHAKPGSLDRRLLDYGALLSKALRGSLHVVHAYAPRPLPPSVTFDLKLRQSLSADAEREPRRIFDEALVKQSIPASRRHLGEVGLSTSSRRSHARRIARSRSSAQSPDPPLSDGSSAAPRRMSWTT